MSSCFLIGHNEFPAARQEVTAARLARVLPVLVRWGITEFRVYGADEFALLAAEAVLRLKAHRPYVCLSLLLPRPTWKPNSSGADAARSRAVLNGADRCESFAGISDEDCLTEQSRQLLEGCSFCVCYLEQTDTPAAAVVAQAVRFGMRVVNLADRNWRQYAKSLGIPE